MILNGKVDAVVDGKKRRFIFNNNVFIKYCEAYGDGTMSSFSANLKTSPIKFYRDLFHLALVEGGEDISLEEFGRAEMDSEEFLRVNKCMTQAMSWGADPESGEEEEDDSKKK